MHRTNGDLRNCLRKKWQPNPLEKTKQAIHYFINSRLNLKFRFIDGRGAQGYIPRPLLFKSILCSMPYTDIERSLAILFLRHLCLVVILTIDIIVIYSPEDECEIESLLA